MKRLFHCKNIWNHDITAHNGFARGDPSATSCDRIGLYRCALKTRDSLNRRTFLRTCAVATAAASAVDPEPGDPTYKVVSPYKGIAGVGMPGAHAGEVVAVHSAKSVDEATETIQADVVKEMMTRGILALTGASDLRSAWSQFIRADDVVGIKVNCVGRPNVVSSPEVVAEVARNVAAVGVPLKNIHIYERFESQMDEVGYPTVVPTGVQYFGAERARGTNLSYDPAMYLEVNFFGEEDTRSNVIRLVSRTLTKIINIPNMKDHGASGVTGCLKNIAYGSFSNVARSHRNGHSFTRTFIGNLAASEPVRSRTVLQIMDGIKGVWHGGPFAANPRFRFFPKQMMFGTDPVAMDRLLLDIIDDYRKSKGAISIWDRDPKYLRASKEPDPNVNAIIREPGHVEYASTRGLGIYDIKRIKVNRIEL
jgi:uncharacterized protein (DUF362 family)